MTERLSRRTVLATTATAGLAAVAGCLSDDDDEESYEVWGLDQGTDSGYIYQPDGDGGFALDTEIDFAAYDDTPSDGIVPHMIDFTHDYEYAVIAATAGSQTLIVRTDDRELVAAVDTGPGSHFASVSPDEEFITVDVIGDGAIRRIDADFEDETFDLTDDEIDIETNSTLNDHEGTFTGSPICHQFDHSGRSIHTLGPSYFDGAVVIVDHDDFTVDTAFGHETLPANCGTIPHPSENKFYLTAGLPSDPEEGREGVGEYYVLDTETDEVLVDGGSTGGVDAHGFWFTPDETELWVLNRETNDGVVLDPETDEVIDEIDAYGPEVSEDPAERDSPDILWSSPDGEYMFATLRGSRPVSGDPHAATGVNPGLSVLDAESRSVETTLTPDAENEDSDFHAVGVRPIDGFEDDETSPPY